MQNQKHPLKSKTIWASILTLVTGLLTATGTITAAQSEIIQSVGPEVLSGLATSVLAVVAAWGRVTATAKVSFKK